MALRIVFLCAVWALGPAVSAREPGALDQLLASAGTLQMPDAPAVRALPEGTPPAQISWQQAPDHVGQYVAVEGALVGAYCNEKVCFLNFSRDFQNHLTLVIFKSAFERFPKNPAAVYGQKIVRATGVIRRSSLGRLELILGNPNQLVILGEGPPEPALYWEDVKPEHAGQMIVVEGVIREVHCTPKICFLNFHRNWTRYVAGMVFKNGLDKFPKPLEELYLGKKVRLKGIVRLYEGRPEIIVGGPSQIEVVP